MFDVDTRNALKTLGFSEDELNELERNHSKSVPLNNVKTKLGKVGRAWTNHANALAKLGLTREQKRGVAQAMANLIKELTEKSAMEKGLASTFNQALSDATQSLKARQSAPKAKPWYDVSAMIKGQWDV